MDLFPPDRLPLIPESTLRAHQVHEPLDTRFRAAARLLQSLWRERAGLTMGAYTARGRRKKLGSRLAALDAAAGGNFLASEIRTLARRELAYREPGAMIDEARVWGNLLSSMPLGFNLFGPLKLNADLAADFVAALVPEFAGKIAHIAFEHSPARGDLAFTADASAFDAFISIRRDDGAKLFLAFEVKYSEGLTEPEPRHRARYDDLSASSGLFIDAEAPELRRNPIQQLWREHMLAHCLVANGLFDEGRFILLAPSQNNDVQRGASAYRTHLAPSPGAVPFLNISLEDAVDALRTAGETEYAQAFTQRYLDFGPVHDLI